MEGYMLFHYFFIKLFFTFAQFKKKFYLCARKL